MFATQLAGASAPSYESNYYCEFIERDTRADTLRRYAGILEAFEKVAPGHRLFDAGCGSGGFLDFARSRGWSVSGIDASETAVRYAMETYHLNVAVADLNRHEFPHGAYDVICAFHLIEHLSNPLHLLTNAAAALVPNGVFYLGLPFYARARIRFHQLLYRTGIANYPFNFNLPDHISYFDKRTLCTTLSAIGLEVVRTWFTARFTLADLAAAARRSSGTRKIIGNSMLPFDKVLRGIGYYQHINVIAQKKRHSVIHSPVPGD